MKRVVLLLVALAVVAALFVPMGASDPPTVAVERGDTLGGLAKTAGVSVAELREWNGIDGDLIHVGQELATGPSGPGKPAWMVLRDRFAPPDEERRWAGILGWLVRNAEALDADGAGRILAFLADEPLDVRGRGVAGLLALARAWVPPVPTGSCAVPKPTQRYRPSGIQGTRLVGMDDSEWTVTELRSWRALFWEGRKMRHCVSMYASRVKTGQCSIWSLRRNGARVLTVEVRNRARDIVQIRGHCNRRATDEERTVLAAWADRAGLSL